MGIFEDDLLIKLSLTIENKVWLVGWSSPQNKTDSKITEWLYFHGHEKQM